VLEVRPITTLDLPELLPYRTLKRQHEHRQEGIFVAEGDKVVRRLLESHFEVISALLPAEAVEPLRPLLERRSETVQVFVADKALLETLTGFSLYQGVLAMGRIPRLPTLPEVVVDGRRPLLLAAVDGLSNAENVGAMVRNCAAFGVHGLVLDRTSSSPYLRRAVRSSMGTLFQLPVVEVPRLPDALRELRDRGVHCVAAHPQVPDQVLWRVDLRHDVCLVFGSEGLGLSPEVLQACDEAAAIPMASAIDSLNVAGAAAVFFAEAARQRWVGR
jgi:tRNA G18 (ribose-2'-O)-methylase SpoU